LLEDLIQICAARTPSERIHAAGSHWALSKAAVSDSVFVETHDPNNLHQAMGRTLYDVVPDCLNPKVIDTLAAVTVPAFDADPEHVGENQGFYPIHVETGKRVYQLYAELDHGDDDPRSLATLLSKRGNTSYLGPWAFQTLGGAGGQTVFGALATGTHGGDFRMPPIADAVLALHLVADGGKHYWIESQGVLDFDLTDDTLLRKFYGQARFGGPRNFEIIRSHEMLKAVLISAGRFGIVYSFIIAAVRQYSLHQERRLTTWQAIKSEIANTKGALYTGQDQPQTPLLPNRFLQVAICVTPHANFTRNLAGVTKRWNVPLAAIPGTNEPAGRPERCGKIVVAFDPLIQAPRFEFAGNSFVYTPDPAKPGMAIAPSFLEHACSNANFLDGVIEAVHQEVTEFIESKGVTVGAIGAAVTAAGGGALVACALAALVVVALALALLLAALRAAGQSRFGQVMNDVRSTLLSSSDPGVRLAGLVVWQMIVFKAFSDQQSPSDFEAISYAVMDGHDYFDQSCNVNVDSIEVFFDATDPMLIAYVDALLAFEITQEVQLGRAFVGYISLRFTGPTRALLGQQRFPTSCAVEVAGLRDVDGVTQLIDFAIASALNRNYQGILHWGQRNESLRFHIEERFGATPADPIGDLQRWRQALNQITEDGTLDGFSSAFTRRTGLEGV